MWDKYDLVSGVGGLTTVKEGAVGHEKTFARSQLAAISTIFMDFIDFHKISSIPMHFKVGGLHTVKGGTVCRRDSFARSQLAAISSIFC